MKDTLFGLFQVNGDSWGRDLISSSIAAAVRTEVSHHNALEFYLKREEIGTLVQTRVTSALQALNVTVHRTGLVAITLPTGLEEAIQDTELARQAKEAAIFAKETAEIEAITKVEVAKVRCTRRGFHSFACTCSCECDGDAPQTVCIVEVERNVNLGSHN